VGVLVVEDGQRRLVYNDGGDGADGGRRRRSLLEEGSAGPGRGLRRPDRRLDVDIEVSAIVGPVFDRGDEAMGSVAAVLFSAQATEVRSAARESRPRKRRSAGANELDIVGAEASRV
jgi:hypothetical protein